MRLAQTEPIPMPQGGTHTMLFTLNSQLCYELAGVADAASNQHDRPVLATVQLGIEDMGNEVMLRAVATDSYMLAKREITIDVASEPDRVIREDSDSELEPVLVDAKAFKKAMKEAAAIKSTIIDRILIEVVEDTVTIAQLVGNSPEIALRTEKLNQYPKWQQLFGERVAKGELTLPALNATLLRRMEQCLSAKPADRGTFPVRLAATKSAGSRASGTEMRPWSFLSLHSDKWYRSEIEVIVMPTRVADAA